MRNANSNDILDIKLGKDVPYNVMFKVVIWNNNMTKYQELKAHRKESFSWQYDMLQQNCVFMEDTEGHVFIAEKDALQVNKKYQDNARKLSPSCKKPHVKGVKPELEYQSHRIKDGVEVKTRNGDIFTIDFTNTLYKESDEHLGSIYLWASSFDIKTGKNKYKCCYDIVQILDNQEENNVKEYYSVGDVFEVGTHVVALASAGAWKVVFLDMRNLLCDAGELSFNTHFEKISSGIIVALVSEMGYKMSDTKYLGKFSDVFERKQNIN